MARVLSTALVLTPLACQTDLVELADIPVDEPDGGDTSGQRPDHFRERPDTGLRPRFPDAEVLPEPDVGVPDTGPLICPWRPLDLDIYVGVARGDQAVTTSTVVEGRGRVSGLLPQITVDLDDGRRVTLQVFTNVTQSLPGYLTSEQVEVSVARTVTASTTEQLLLLRTRREIFAVWSTTALPFAELGDLRLAERIHDCTVTDGAACAGPLMPTTIVVTRSDGSTYPVVPGDLLGETGHALVNGHSFTAADCGDGEPVRRSVGLAFLDP